MCLREWIKFAIYEASTPGEGRQMRQTSLPTPASRLEHLLAKVWYQAFHYHNTTNSQWRRHSTTRWSQKGPHEESRTTTWASVDLIRVNVVVIVLELIVRDQSGRTYLSCRSLIPDWVLASLLEWFWATNYTKNTYTKISLIAVKFRRKRKKIRHTIKSPFNRRNYEEGDFLAACLFTLYG